MASTNDIVRLREVGKVFPGAERSLRGTKIEIQGPALWMRNLGRAVRLTAGSAVSVRALDDVSIDVRPGEVFGILGPNGSGKTTLVKIIAGLLRPSEGSGEVAGVDLNRPVDIRRRVSYVSTTGWMGLEWALTAEENVRFFGLLSGMPRALVRTRSEQALRDVGLWQDRCKAVSELSNGMRQRVILARALLLRTPLVLLDEPTVGLDPLHRDQVLALVRQTLPARGQTVILVDHQADALEGVIDRAAILERGRLVRVGTPADLVSSLEGIRVLELLTRGNAEPNAETPHQITGVERIQRPGALGLTQWRVTASNQSDTVQAVLSWIMSGGGEVVQVAEREPRLADVIARTTLWKEARG